MHPFPWQERPKKGSPFVSVSDVLLSESPLVVMCFSHVVGGAVFGGRFSMAAVNGSLSGQLHDGLSVGVPSSSY